jgi:2-oxoglutarate ferredoxin oxidoreductase subunit delta
MPKIDIKTDKCKGCLLCIVFCPKGAIEVGDKLNLRGVKAVKPKDGAECTGCSMCAIICPDCCIEVYK